MSSPKVRFFHNISNKSKAVFPFFDIHFYLFGIYDFLYKKQKITKREINSQKTEKSDIRQHQNCKRHHFIALLCDNHKERSRQVGEINE